ncbi:MAG: 1-(5-phosphoribosyl)-5-[(5-phosphoribosylamino)methylideneamino]imidazole-4-carboxamide isomerase [Bacteroidales bacterium]|jgi:phosphoribosylformimino-5-aminoimidazole carboxamide ribotide isomerase
MRIIVAIDIIGGKCVRLTRGDYSTMKIYNEDPLEAAREIEDNGIEFIHLVDLDGAKNKRITNYKVIERISAKTKLTIDFGGGIRSDQDLKIAFDCGARQVTAGTIALNSPDLFFSWLTSCGNEKIILGADSIDHKIASDGWVKKSEKDVIEYISEYCSKGVRYSICTEIGRDGMMEGPAINLYKEILGSANIDLIASGGISKPDDILEIKEAGCEGVIVGKAVYEGKIKLKELRNLC